MLPLSAVEIDLVQWNLLRLITVMPFMDHHTSIKLFGVTVLCCCLDKFFGCSVSNMINKFVFTLRLYVYSAAFSPCIRLGF